AIRARLCAFKVPSSSIIQGAPALASVFRGQAKAVRFQAAAIRRFSGGFVGFLQRFRGVFAGGLQAVFAGGFQGS
ncbi:hypothetical protein SOVF_163050, partial [Spinacia oleracea]